MSEFNKMKYDNDYITNNYDVIKLTLPKGKKDILKKHCLEKGESVNAFIRRAIDNQIKTDNGSDNVQ